MTENPIGRFLNQMATFHVHDVALLFRFVALQEEAPTGVISPVMASRCVMVDGLTQSEYKASFDRLRKLGELEWVDGEVEGFRVVRLDQLRDYMTDFGRRRYQRIKRAESRSK